MEALLNIVKTRNCQRGIVHQIALDLAGYGDGLIKKCNREVKASSDLVISLELSPPFPQHMGATGSNAS
jgi:hypothetical protein